MKEDKEGFKRRLKAFIASTIDEELRENLEAFKTRLKSHFGISTSKPETPSFDVKSKEILTLIHEFKEKVTKKRYDTAMADSTLSLTERTLFEQYHLQIGPQNPHDFFKSIFSDVQKIARLSEHLYKEKIKQNPCLVIFNEMFFSKDRPLTPEEFTAVEGRLKDLTHRHRNLLLHANFLYQRAQTFEKESDYKDFIAAQKKNADLLAYHTGKQIFESDRYLGGYEAYKDQFLIYQPSLNILRNQSFVYWNGRPITHYLKSSYRTEADNHLEGKLYELGTGIDQIFPDDTPLFQRVAKTVQAYLSTEICYDLEIGVRKRLSSYPANGKVHIVVSNTLSLAQGERIENLPVHIPLTIHVDPDDQEIFLENEMRALLVPANVTVSSGNPLHPGRYSQLTKAMPLATFRINLTNNNVFIFHIWDLQQCLQTALFCQTALGH